MLDAVGSMAERLRGLRAEAGSQQSRSRERKCFFIVQHDSQIGDAGSLSAMQKTPSVSHFAINKQTMYLQKLSRHAVPAPGARNYLAAPVQVDGPVHGMFGLCSGRRFEPSLLEGEVPLGGLVGVINQHKTGIVA